MKVLQPFFFVLVLIVMIAMSYPAQCASQKATQSVVEIPADATPDQLRAVMSSMTDEQARRMLIEELKREGGQTVSKETQPKGLAGFVSGARKSASFIRHRFEYLFSGASTAPRELPRALQTVFSGDKRMPPGRIFLALFLLTMLWLLAMYVFKRKTSTVRKSISRLSEGASWLTRLWRLFLRALLDLLGVITVATVVFVGYLILFTQGAAAKPVIIAWLVAIVFLSLFKVVVRFLLAPHAPELRYLPLSGPVARYLFRWSVRVARVMATGLLLTTLLRLEGGSEALTLLVSAFFGFIVAAMIALIALWNKKPVADHIRATHQPGTLLFDLAESWHLAAIAYVLGFWVFWLFALMVFGSRAMLAGVMTLLIVPAYFFVDWLTQRLINFAVDLSGKNVPDESEGHGVGSINKFRNFVSRSFQVLVFAGAVFLLFRLWGIDFTLGREVVRAGFNIVLTLVLAYIFWIYISGLIERKLKEKQGDGGHDDGGGEGGGGPGGDRFSTLLQLVKRFIFATVAVVTVLIMLSSIGVDIGPLIAGASVFGIAIGFGAQTLVKDIISGIFFLMDDAFRIGDYIIVGSAMGTVEKISVRSFKLRHHLGPLYTIPFGSVKDIQNMTRDWSIMKLQYLVPLDSDPNKIKKIVKKINKEIRAVPELNEFMLDDIKSQGVKAIEEHGLRMRIKFKTKPGGQFTLRKLVLAKLRREFSEAGIEFSSPRVLVQFPKDLHLSPEEQAAIGAAAGKSMERESASKKDKGNH